MAKFYDIVMICGGTTAAVAAMGTRAVDDAGRRINPVAT